MALSQRLEFRQTQGLVMTPQLMQAIKLLQLSSLDLAAYVEGELERNPLLERASEDEAPAAAPNPKRRRPNATRTQPVTRTGSGPTSRPAAAPWSRGSAPNSKMYFPTMAGKKLAPAETPPPAYSEWSGAGSGGAGDDYNLEAFVSARDHAGRSPRRADGAGDLQSGWPHDRAILDRYGGRGRLSHRRSRHGCRQTRRTARVMSSLCLRFCRPSIRRACARAI